MKEEERSYSDPGQPSDTGILTIVAGYCKLTQTPACRPSDWQGPTEGVQLFLYTDEESFELGQYFRSCTTNNEGRCVLSGLPQGNLILLSRYDEQSEKETVRILSHSNTFHYLVYPYVN